MKLSIKQLENQWILNNKEYEYFLNHGITIEKYIFQTQEKRNKEITQRRDREKGGIDNDGYRKNKNPQNNKMG